MKAVSNNALVAILAVALVVSLSASLYSVTEVSELGSNFDALTGAAVVDGAPADDVVEEPVVEEVPEEEVEELAEEESDEVSDSE